MRLSKCCVCEKEDRQGNLKRVNKKWYCSKHYKELRLNHRRESIKEAGITEEIKELERKIKRESEEKHKEKRNEWHRERYHRLNPNAGHYNRQNITLEEQMANKQYLPRIKNAKIKKESIALALSKEDKQILLRKHMREGLGYEDAKKAVEEANEYMKDLGKRLRANRNIQPEDKDKLFKEEFAKICYS